MGTGARRSAHHHNQVNSGRKLGRFMRKLGQGITSIAAIAILAAGCSSGSSSTSTASSASSDGSGAVSGGKAGSATYVSGTPLSNQLTTATITDPSLGNIVAGTLTMPAGGKLQGVGVIGPGTF